MKINTKIFILILFIVNVTNCNNCITKNCIVGSSEYIGDDNFYVESDDFDKYYGNKEPADTNNFYILPKFDTKNSIDYYYNDEEYDEAITKREVSLQPLNRLFSFNKERYDDEFSNYLDNLNEFRQQFLYWFYDNNPLNGNNSDYQNNVNELEPKVQKELNFNLPFFGFQYRHITISLHGYLEFSESPEYSYDDYPLEFPVKLWPKRNDPSFIGIFYSKCRIGKIYPHDHDQRAPGLYYRLGNNLQNTTSKFKIALRERVKLDIREGIVGAEDFMPNHVLIITWKNVSFGGGSSPYITNTFQVVLATDELSTYAIFNYATIDWTTHLDAGGDVELGLGGYPAFVGFNAGSGVESFEYFPYSQSIKLKELVNTGYTNHFQGRHIFRIDENILVGSCHTSDDETYFPLVFAPESGSMLGGTIVNVTGPCFNSLSRILCRFGDQINPGYIADRTRAICIQPFINTAGYLPFHIAIENEVKKWHGIYFVETPDAVKGDIEVDKNIYDMAPKSIRLDWKMESLRANRIKITLWGYKETNSIPELIYIDEIITEHLNTGFIEISLGDYNRFIDRDNQETNDLQIGFLKLTADNLLNENYLQSAMWSTLIPLAWYFWPQWNRLYNDMWAANFCRTWINNDRLLGNFTDQLPACPCTFEQAKSDKGQYIPDYEYIKGDTGIACFRSSQSTMAGSVQHCCYNSKSQDLLTASIITGSRPRRFGKTYLSTWYNEYRPYLFCCLWQDIFSKECPTFLHERVQSVDCMQYEKPGIGAIFGGLHYVTFDNLRYTFNGMGEFLITRGNAYNDVFEIQGRFQKIIKTFNNNLVSTHLTSIVAKGNNSTVIEVNLRPPNAQGRYRLDVLANGRKTYFEKPQMKFQTHNDIIVYTPSYINNQSEIFIILNCGVGIEIVESNGFMAARIYVPKKFNDKISGLLGNNNFDRKDDFFLPNGKEVEIINFNTFEKIHFQFGLYWMLSDLPTEFLKPALFNRKYYRTSHFYQDKSLRPNFIQEPENFLKSKAFIVIDTANKICDASYQCRYDYGMTVNKEMALFTKRFFYDTNYIKEVFELQLQKCGNLEAPLNGIKLNHSFNIGSLAIFQCNPGYIMSGDNQRLCTFNGTWSKLYLGVTTCTKASQFSDNIGNLPLITKFVSSGIGTENFSEASLLSAMLFIIVMLISLNVVLN